MFDVNAITLPGGKEPQSIRHLLETIISIVCSSCGGKFIDMNK